jgi:hypothetical protein
MTTRRPDLHQMIRELTQPTQHHEPYLRKRKPRYHTTNNPPLLAQLDESAMPSNNRIDGAGTVAGSRPAANVDAIDTARRINRDATDWLNHYSSVIINGDTDLARDIQRWWITDGDIVDRVRRLALIALYDHDLANDIRRWWTWARTTTGWDQPPWQPHNTCPLCAHLGTIRVRAEEKLASCTNDECRATWEPDTFGLLVEHIRTENGEAKAS